MEIKVGDRFELCNPIHDRYSVIQPVIAPKGAFGTVTKLRRHNPDVFEAILDDFRAPAHFNRPDGHFVLHVDYVRFISPLEALAFAAVESDR